MVLKLAFLIDMLRVGPCTMFDAGDVVAGVGGHDSPFDSKEFLVFDYENGFEAHDWLGLMKTSCDWLGRVVTT